MLSTLRHRHAARLAESVPLPAGPLLLQPPPTGHSPLPLPRRLLSQRAPRRRDLACGQRHHHRCHLPPTLLLVVQ
ncbi:hypothetical protein LINGRAPRIM_LOCUS212 [Linum grandiflorum]